MEARQGCEYVNGYSISESRGKRPSLCQHEWSKYGANKLAPPDINTELNPES